MARLLHQSCYNRVMAEQKRRPSIPVLGGRARLIRPTERRRTWQITYADPITQKRRIVSGGRTEEEATAKALAILGDFVPDNLKPGAQAPTVQQAVDDWIETNRQRWNSRTANHYEYQAKKLTTPYGTRTVSSITPADIKKIDTSTISRGEQKHVRGLVRAVFRHVEQWLHTDPETLAKAVVITGTKDDDRATQVSRGDIPTIEYVNSLITTCYTTLNHFERDNGREVKITPLDYNTGAPPEMIQRMRRGIPKHYKRLAEHRAKEDAILNRFQMFGLIYAVAAGGGLRVGELLALRARHFFPDATQLPFEALTLEGGDENVPLFMSYLGSVDVCEQASQASHGAIYLTAPKMKRTRTVWLPAILPANGGQQFMADTTTRQRAARIVPRFEDPMVSMWTMTRKEALDLWMKEQPPLAFMLWLRLHEMWMSDVVQSQRTDEARAHTFQSLLVFPTRNPVRKQYGEFQPNIRYAKNWPHDVRIVPGTGGYQATTGLAGYYLNPLFDYVSKKIGGANPYYPAHRIQKKTGRKGWTLHGLRHYAVSSWLASSLVSLAQVSAQAGHKDISFTLDRYGHLMDDPLIKARGFEI